MAKCYCHVKQSFQKILVSALFPEGFFPVRSDGKVSDSLFFDERVE